MKSWSTTVVTPLSSDTEPTVLVNFDGAKYIFNVGENTNRAFTQSQQNYKRMSGVFLTQVNSQRARMLMSFADGGTSKLSVLGPPGLRHYMASMRSFVYRPQMAVTTTECLSDQDATLPEVFYKDDNITVYAFPISNLVPFPKYEASMAALSKAGKKRKRSQSPEENKPTEEKPSKVVKLDENDTLELSPDVLRETAIQLMFPPKQLGQIPAGPAKEGETTETDEYRRIIPAWFHRQLPSFLFPPAFPRASTLAYIVVGPRVRGKIDGNKLHELGVPFNELRSKLAKGETIQFEAKSPDGPYVRTVRPEDVTGKSDPPAAVIMLDVPSVEMIPSVVRSFDTVYKPFRSSNPNDLEKHTVRVIYHLLGPGVLEDKRYKAFMRGFPAATEHVISSPEHSPNPVTFTSFALNQYRLSQLDSEAFPIPKFNLSPMRQLSDVPSLPPKVHIMAANIHIPLRPPGPLQIDHSVPHDRFHSVWTPERLLSKDSRLPETTVKAFEDAKEALSQRPPPEIKRPSHVKVLPLGTSSTLPNKYRNVLSTLIRTPNGNILLDAGEGTLGQLIRRFGVGSEEDVDVMLAKLKCIFLAKPPQHPLYVVTVRKVHVSLKESHELEDLGLCDDPKENGVIPILSEALNFRYNEYPTMGLWRIGGNEPWADINLSRRRVSDMCRLLALEFFKTIDVHHRTKAYAAYFRSRDSWSIAFSGDTMPATRFSRIANGATLLIHEATMADGEEELASTKAHSTVGQAIQVARDMNAKNVLLTHFSARYPKMPPSILAPPEEKKTERGGPLVTLAFDLAEMDLDQMWKMNLYLPAIEQCFKDSSEEGDEDLYATVPGSLDG
ncbi:hypothetical protein D9756_002186 [Leucocoprinus leucothites]|uniref:ribonuclease Z n=1 Tax=Leucocoprinus leucothites TaxID=201217 RepID=A0A8H5LM95_9AGAR|nr:hypothetical protein D9756_002186 [Leucoagaricus leucothites]